jgi:hypothetical protein
MAQNPDDVNFTLRLIKDRPEYAVDEPITFEISLSSSTDHKYYASWTSLGPYGGSDITLDPKEGAVDFRAFQNGFTGSILGSAGYLSDAPVKETGDLTEWYRFEKPGHFRMTVAVDWVSRIQSAEQGGGKENIRMQSNTVEFDIRPPDPSSQLEELYSILREIDQQTSQGTQPDLHRLDLLQTPAAAHEEVGRYLAAAHDGYNPYAYLLQDSSELEEIIPLLQQALRNPSVDLPPGIVDLLTQLQIRKLREQPAQPKNRQEDLFEQNNKELLASIRLRSGPERMSAEFEAWSNAERHYNPTDPVPQLLIDLRADVLSGVADLSPGNQWQFLINLWNKVPHAELLPTVRRLARPKLPANSFRGEAFKLWCEGWPSDCAEAMIEDERQNSPELYSGTILLIPERERPDLGAFLQARLRDPQLPRSREGGLTTATLILRAGSKTIQPGVEAFLDAPSAPYSQNCAFDGYLLGYLFRVSPEKAATRLRTLLQNPNPEFCGAEALRSLHHAGKSQLAVPIVAAALNSANFMTAGNAALFLGECGPTSARVDLLNRLEALRMEWHDRASQIRSARLLERPQWGVAQFETELVSALANTRAWILTPEEREEIAAGCFTDQCRQMATGKSRLSF